MQTLIYVALTPSTLTTYDPDLLQWIRATFPKVVIFDFDNHSSPALADYAIELIKRSDIVIVVITNNDVPEVPIGNAMRLLQFITREKKQAIQLLLYGRHAAIEKMWRAFKEPRFYQTVEEQTLKEKILALLSQ